MEIPIIFFLFFFLAYIPALVSTVLMVLISVEYLTHSGEYFPDYLSDDENGNIESNEEESGPF